MKVILREDVQNLGKSGDVVKVKPGYARNYLLPRKLAVEATEENMRVLEQERRAQQRRDLREKASAEQQASRLEATSLTVKRRAGEEDQLYGSVTAADIAEELAARGIEVDRRKILLEEPIKKLGQFQVEVKLHREVTARLNLSVERAEEE